MIILIDNGHGIDTLGKCSPDKSYYEWRWCREMAAMIQAELQRRGYDARLLVPEQRDIDLKERVRRANQVCVEHGSGNVILLSIHSNASGNGEWKSARGWSAYTTRGLTNSDRLATSLYNAAERYLYGQRIRADYSDGDPDWEADFYIIRRTVCPAVLTENFFHDNRDDLVYIQSNEGKKSIMLTHVEGVDAYIKDLYR